MKILLLAIRSLMRFRLYTVINVFGLALSLACVIIISRYVYSEATTDHFNKNHERMYLSVRHWGEGEQKTLLCTTDNVLMKRDYVNPLDIPEIEQRTSFVSLGNAEIKVDEKRFKAHVLATDTFFLQILVFPVIEGSRSRLLTDPKGVGRRLIISVSPWLFPVSMPDRSTRNSKRTFIRRVVKVSFSRSYRSTNCIWIKPLTKDRTLSGKEMPTA